nr:hypothetical protein JVH1_9182 [Rhodococcus sp. JVH1]
MLAVPGVAVRAVSAIYESATARTIWVGRRDHGRADSREGVPG